LARTDVNLLKTVSDPTHVRDTNNMAFITQMENSHAQGLFYFNELAGDSFNGLTQYVKDPTALNGNMMINMGGTTAVSQASIYLVGWSDYTVHGIFAKNLNAGLKHTAYGTMEAPISHTYTDAEGVERTIREVHDEWVLNSGVAVLDPRFVGRICNIELDQAKMYAEDAATGLASVVNNIATRVNDLLNRLPHTNVKLSLYAPGPIMTMIESQAYNKQNEFVKFESREDGLRMTKVCGVPLKKCQALSLTEDVVTGF
jgi:hypothetical protein